MELTVYRQAYKERPGGTIVYKGEDALPYTDNQLLLVADGLGGAAAIRHLKIKPEIFEKEKLLDTLFSGIYEDYSNEVFVKYVTDSFFELFAVKDCYTDNINNIKKSGYFASRIVAAIILHEMLYNQQYSAEEIFKTLAACETEEARAEYLASVGKHFKDTIQTDIKKVAKNANLIYESSYSGLALLGSTLCATIFLEHEDSVEAIYLTAGDSRPYVWCEEKGLSQVLADQEGEDGGMTNYIKANDDADFTIRCNYFKFAKPCVLFNASDGCFDSYRFLSQIGFEKIVLEYAISSENVENMSKGIKEFFTTEGRHDDSSTIAMKMFGYESFEDFKASCQKRYGYLSAEYFEKMPDLIDKDYVAELEQSKSTLPKLFESLKEKFVSEQDIINYCEEYVKSGDYDPYNKRKTNLDNAINVENGRYQHACNQIEEVIKDNYIKFKPQKEKGISLESVKVCDIEKCENKHNNAIAKYTDDLKRLKDCFDETTEKLKTLIDAIYQVGVPASFEDYDDVSFNFVNNCEKNMDDLFDFFHKLKDKKLEAARAIFESRQKYVEKNKKLAEKHIDVVQDCLKNILEGKINLDDISILDEEKAIINDSLAIINNAKAKMNHINTVEAKEITKECVNIYWEKHYYKVIVAVIENPDTSISAELVAEAKGIIREIEEKTGSIKEKAEMQKALFDKYDETYLLYIGG